VTVSAADDYLARLREIVHARGGELLSRRYVNTTTRVRVRCSAGHRWAMTPDHLKEGRWCSRCAKEARHRARLRELEQAVAERGGRIMSRYRNATTHVQLQCAAGHRFRTLPTLVMQGSWCRVCTNEARVARQRDAAVDRLQEVVAEFGGRMLSAWAGARGPLRFECEHGHRFWREPHAVRQGNWCSVCRGTRRTIEDARDLADEHDGHCLSSVYRGPQAHLRWRCAAGHEWDAPFDAIMAGRWCPHCNGLPRGDLDQMRSLAVERGGQLLSTRYGGASIKLRWRCAEGHTWLARPADVVKGSWCHACGKAKGGRRKLTLDDMRHTAAERGGQCLSEVYVNNKQRLRWRCARGHQWLAFGNRVRQGAWCPECKYAVRGTLGRMQALAVERGGRCLSRTWNDHRRPLRFRCAEGHTFCLLASAIRTGVWCPRCAAGPASMPAHARVGSDRDGQ
jgi:hypothetical protein